MSTRSRVAAFGSSGLLVLAGVVCAATVAGGTGQVLAFAFIGLGLVAIVSLVFLEVGLSEDRELARQQDRPRRKLTRRGKRGSPPRPERSHRRRLS